MKINILCLQRNKSVKETVTSFHKNFSESELNTSKASIEKLSTQLNSLQAKISNNDFEDIA